MAKKYTLADFPHRDTVNCLNDGDVKRIYIPLLTEPDCPIDLMDKANCIINDLLASCPEQKYNVNDLFIYVQLWVTVLKCGRIVHSIDVGIFDSEDHINLSTRYIVLNTDPVYSAFKEYFSRKLTSVLFDKTSLLTLVEMENGIYHVLYDFQKEKYFVEHVSIRNEQMEPPRYFSSEKDARKACKVLIQQQKAEFGGNNTY